MKQIKDVYAIVDEKGKVVDVVHRPSQIHGFKGWRAIKGRFIPNKRQPKS